MAKTPRPWIVTSHDPIQKIDDNLWTVDGDVPGLPIKRRMAIIKRSNGDLVFFNAVPLKDEVLEEVRSWGRPAMLLVPHHQHMIDGHAFREKLGLKLYGSAECADEIKKRAKLDGLLQDIAEDEHVKVHASQGNKLGEPVIEVRSGGGARVSLLFGDMIQNTPSASLGLMFRMMGFGGGPKVVPVFKMMFVKDKARLKEQIAGWSELKNLTRLMPSHGNLVSEGAAAALKAAGENA
jgi:hypothetical protein